MHNLNTCIHTNIHAEQFAHLRCAIPRKQAYVSIKGPRPQIGLGIDTIRVSSVLVGVSVRPVFTQESTSDRIELDFFSILHYPQLPDRKKMKILQLFIIRVADHRFKLEQKIGTEGHAMRGFNAYFPEWKLVFSKISLTTWTRASVRSIFMANASRVNTSG